LSFQFFADSASITGVHYTTMNIKNKEKPSVPDLKVFGKAGAASSSSSTTRSNRPSMTAGKQLSINTITKVATITHTQEIFAQEKENYENLLPLPTTTTSSKTSTFPSLQRQQQKEKEKPQKLTSTRPQPVLSLTNKENPYYSSALEEGNDDDEEEDEEDEKQLYNILEKLKNAQSSATISKKRFESILSSFTSLLSSFLQKKNSGIDRKRTRTIHFRIKTTN
jgi:hypothetical protein